MSPHGGAFRQTLRPNFPPPPHPPPHPVWELFWGNCQHLVVISSVLAGTPVGCLLGCGCVLSRLPGQVLPSVTEAQAALPFFMLFQCCRGRRGSTHPEEKVGSAIFTCDWQSDSSAGWGQVGTVMESQRVGLDWAMNMFTFFFMHECAEWNSGVLENSFQGRLFYFEFYLGEKKSLRVASTFHWSNGRRDYLVHKSRIIFENYSSLTE